VCPGHDIKQPGPGYDWKLPIFIHYNLSYIKKGGETMTKCPVCDMMVDENTAPSLEHKGKKYYFMNPTHKEMFEADPGKYLDQEKNQMDMDNH
jgi:YHS domain-containing protein